MKFIDISDNEYDISESDTHELYSPINPQDSENNFLILPSVPQTPPTNPHLEDEVEFEHTPQPQVQVEIQELNVIPPPSSSSIPSPPLLSLNNDLINEPIQLNDIFSLPQLIENLQLFSNRTYQGRRHAMRMSPFQLNQNDPIENVLQTSLEDTGGYKNVISEEGKKEIKFLEYETSKFEEKKCSITQEEFEEGQIVAQLPCNHIFNKKCLLYWLENESNACPVCRRELKYKEVKIEYDSEEESNQEQNQIPIENVNTRLNNIIGEINARNRRHEEQHIQQAIFNSLIINQTSSSPPPTETPQPSTFQTAES